MSAHRTDEITCIYCGKRVDLECWNGEEHLSRTRLDAPAVAPRGIPGEPSEAALDAMLDVADHQARDLMSHDKVTPDYATYRELHRDRLRAAYAVDCRAASPVAAEPTELAQRLLREATQLPPDAQRVLYDHLWELYLDGCPHAVPRGSMPAAEPTEAMIAAARTQYAQRHFQRSAPLHSEWRDILRAALAAARGEPTAGARGGVRRVSAPGGPLDLADTRHPHEPAIPVALDAEGRCLVCCLIVEREEARAALREVDELAEAARQLINDVIGREDLDDDLLYEAAGKEFPQAHDLLCKLQQRAAAVLASVTDGPEAPHA